MQKLHKVIIQLLSIAFCLTNISLSFGDTISGTTHGTAATFIDNPGSYTKYITISGVPVGAKITNVQAVFSYSHCPYDDVKITLLKQKGDVAPLFFFEDWTPQYITRNLTANNNSYFANSTVNDVWGLKIDISPNIYSQKCPTDPSYCVSGYTEHSAYFYEWTITITYSVPPVNDKPTASPKRQFTGSTTNITPSFQWSTVPNATSYDVRVFDTFNTSNILFENPGVTSTSYSPSLFNLQPLHRYGWNVAGVNSVNTGPRSMENKFLIGPSMECWPELGSGNGLDIETCYDLNSSTDNYLLKDISRRANMNVVGRDGVGHNGNMSDSASIKTELGTASFPIQITDSDNFWDDVKSVDAHINTAKVYDYLNSQYQGQYRFYRPPPAMISVILYQNTLRSVVESEDQNCRVTPAFYDDHYLTPVTVQFCKGTSSSTYLDVVGHEWAHALTRLATIHGDMTRSGEPGALNEAFSDWMATAIKHVNNDNSWIITITDVYNRNLSNPLLSNPAQPVWYGGGANWVYCSPSETPNDDNDDCGVHYNSGVPNQMFYLLSQSIGIEKAIKIAYKANTERWTANSTFADARDGMIWAAGQLYSLSEATQVDQAWAAVGVTPTSTPASLTTRRLMSILSGLLLND